MFPLVPPCAPIRPLARLRALLTRYLPSSLLTSHRGRVGGESTVQAAPRSLWLARGAFPRRSFVAPRSGGPAYFPFPTPWLGRGQDWVAASRFSRTVCVIWWSGPR